MRRRRNQAFTLIEIMIVIAIMADIMVIALPSYMRARTFTQNAIFTNDLRTAASAFEMYSAENGRWPNESNTGVIPGGMTAYLNGVDWMNRNSLGARWDWDNNTNGSVAAIAVIMPDAGDDLRMTDVDTRIDNGILTTGNFRKRTGTRYVYILE